ncbi:hypothetical protein JCM15060_06010 [Halanaerobaculum tunisiense]
MFNCQFSIVNYKLIEGGPTMKKVMLVLFSFENLDQVIDRAFELVEPDDELYVAGFIE